jgi:hypothetical protein
MVRTTPILLLAILPALAACQSGQRIPLISGLIQAPKVSQHADEVLVLADHASERSRLIAQIAADSTVGPDNRALLASLAQEAAEDAHALRRLRSDLRAVSEGVIQMARQRDSLASQRDGLAREVQKAREGSQRILNLVTFSLGGVCLALGVFLAIFGRLRTGVSLAVSGLTLVGLGRFLADWGWWIGVGTGVLILVGFVYVMWAAWQQRLDKDRLNMVSAELVGNMANAKDLMGKLNWENLKAKLSAEQSADTQIFVDKVKNGVQPS